MKIDRDTARQGWVVELNEIPDDIDSALTSALAGFRREDATTWSITDSPGNFLGDIVVAMKVVGTGCLLEGFQKVGYSRIGEKRLNITAMSLLRWYPEGKVSFAFAGRPQH